MKKNGIRGRSIAVLLWIGSVAVIFADTNDRPAKVSVKGYGLFGNRELKSVVQLLEPTGKKPKAFEANFVEDAVLILFSRVNRDGYLHPIIKAEIQTVDGQIRTFTWTDPVGVTLPRPLGAKKVKFDIEKGVRFYYDEIRFDGVNAIPLKDAAHFFIETDALIKLKENRIYTPEKLRSGLRNLEAGLERLGYESASALATNLVVNTNTGVVNVDIVVTEGPQSIVRSIRKEVFGAESAVPPEVQTNAAPATGTIQTNVIFSRLWEQDFRQILKREQYRAGHADARVETSQEARDLQGKTNYIDIAAQVWPGPVLTVHNVEFEGQKKASTNMMARRVQIHAGDLLNPVKAEQGRYRLARLGIFDTVDLRYDKVDEESRDLIYTVKEGKRMNFSLLAGYGSYEQLRAGFEWEQYDLWGLAHHSRLRAVQSFKSSSADYTYTIPDLLGHDVDGFLNASGLIRDEPAFTRKEFGGGMGLSRNFRSINTDFSGRYSYQVLSATRRNIPPEFGLSEADVSSFIFDMRHDRRDNPLTPREGYKLFTTFEVASDALGGDASFERVETSFSFHHPVGNLRWVHFGVSHGFVVTPNSPAQDLPVNRRFFPGGDSSIRGYQFGEAAPRDANGDLVGAETYTLANVEFEQGLTRNISLVVFFDALGEATRIESYPFDQGLYSAGLGIRWKTIIGPVRIEYGRNINPRHQDPDGTLQIAIGFPF
jgi:outer membrane protein insertion porin family